MQLIHGEEATGTYAEIYSSGIVENNADRRQRAPVRRVTCRSRRGGPVGIILTEDDEKSAIRSRTSSWRAVGTCEQALERHLVKKLTHQGIRTILEELPLHSYLCPRFRCTHVSLNGHHPLRSSISHHRMQCSLLIANHQLPIPCPESTKMVDQARSDRI